MVRRSSSVMPGVAAVGQRTMDVPGWPGAPTVSQCIPPYWTSLRSSKPRVSREKARDASGSSCGRRVAWMVMSMAAMLGAARYWRFSIPDRSCHLFRHARRDARHRARRLAPVGAGRHTNQFGEASAEGAQRRAADLETDLGDTEVATTKQRHRALDASRHQVAVRRLTEGEPELAAEVPGGHVRVAGERLDVQRLRVLPVDPVADAAQQREVAQVLHRGGSAGHLRNRATYDCM